MPEYPLRDSIITSLNAQEPWPDNVKLFQPYEVEQILLPDNASCLAVQAFLKMCNLPFEVEMRWNAEWMSPSGRVPFIKCGAFVVSELEPIVQFAANKGVSLCSQLATEEKAEMRAYMSLITNVLVNAELYVSWIDNDTFNTVTKVRNSSVYPWPLGWIQTRAKRNMVAKRLKALNWYDKTLDQVLADVEQCCNSLSQRLGEKDYFFGTPTPLDALVYGHLRSLLAATGPKAALMIKPITSALLRLVLRMANLTAMKLTPQEDYLVTQAFQVSRRRKMSPDRESRNSRTRRSRMSMRNPSRDSLGYSRDMFGFKPFACKHIIIMTSKEGHITCELDGRRHDKAKVLNEEQNNFIVEIIEDILDKVEEFAFTEKIYFETEKNDFEVIAFANNYVDSKYGSLDMKFDELRESNETLNDDDDISLVDDDNLTLQGDTNTPIDVENDDIDVMPFESGLADVLEIINDEDEMLDLFDGLGNDEYPKLGDEDNVELNDAMIESVLETSTEIDSSNNNEMLESYLCISSGDQSSPRLVNSSGDRGSISNLSPDLKSPKSASSTKSSRFSSESKSTLKIPSNEEISVESLLRCLRKRNAAYNSYPDIADID